MPEHFGFEISPVAFMKPLVMWHVESRRLPRTLVKSNANCWAARMRLRTLTVRPGELSHCGRILAVLRPHLAQPLNSPFRFFRTPVQRGHDLRFAPESQSEHLLCMLHPAIPKAVTNPASAGFLISAPPEGWQPDAHHARQTRYVGQDRGGHFKSTVAGHDHGHRRFSTAHPLRRQRNQ